jgi:hypothetical protein
MILDVDKPSGAGAAAELVEATSRCDLADDTTKVAMRRDFLTEMDDLRSARGPTAR